MVEYVYIPSKKVKVYKSKSTEVLRDRLAKRERGTYVSKGEAVYVISIRGDEIRFQKYNANGERNENIVYIDYKKYYV